MTQDLARSGAMLPAGFVNMGNTCYMNSTLQCMRKVTKVKPSVTALFVLDFSCGRKQKGGEGGALQRAFNMVKYGF